MAEFLSKEINMVLVGESAWNATPGTDYSGGFALACIPGSIKVDTKTNVSGLQYSSSLSIYEEESRKLISNAGILPTIDFECYATPDALQLLLGRALFTTTSADAGATLQYLPTNGVIDFPADEAVPLSVFVWSQAGDGVSLKNAVLNNITISMENVGAGETRMGKISGQLIGTAMLTDQTFTVATGLSDYSTLIDYTMNRGDSVSQAFTLTLSTTGLSSSDFCWRRYSLTINNNITSDCFTGNEANNLRRGNPTIEHTIDIPHNDETDGLLGNFKSGDVVAFTLTNGYTAGLTGYMKFQDGGAAYITKPPMATEGGLQSNSLVLRDWYDGTAWNIIAAISILIV